MLTVTALAGEKLKEAIQAQMADPEVAIRLVPSPSMPDRLELTLDKEQVGDQVVESEGVKVLLLGPEVAPALEGMVIDCEETPEGVRFTISELAPDA